MKTHLWGGGINTINFNINANSVGQIEAENADLPETKTWIPKYSEGSDVRWQSTDRLYLLEIDSENNYKAYLSTGINRKKIQGKDYYLEADFPFELRKNNGVHKYWARIINNSKGNDYWTDNQSNASQYPFTISSEQFLDVSNSYDPRCDIFLSNLVDDKSQVDFATDPKMTFTRHNAVARIWMKGLPIGGTLLSLKFTADKNISGTKNYDILSNSWTDAQGSRTINATTASSKYDYYKDSYGNPYYCAHLSLWPCDVNSYEIEAQVELSDKSIKKYAKNVKRNTPLSFRENTISQWAVNMEEVKPLTESVSEVNLNGTRTYDIYRNQIKHATDHGGIADDYGNIDQWWTHKLGYDGVEIHEAKFTHKNQFVHSWIIEVDPTKATFAVGSPFDVNTPAPFKNLQTVSGQINSAIKGRDLTVLAAINGDAWGGKPSEYKPYGIMWKDGIVLKHYSSENKPVGNKDVFYVTDQGEVDIVDEQTFIGNITKNKTVTQAIGGWYRLLDEYGKPIKRSNTVNVKDAPPVGINPRTFLGISQDRVYLIVFDGRRPGWSAGITMDSAAILCYNLGCKKAINLDGGGSTTIVKRWEGGFKLLNQPTDGSERAVVNSLMVVAK